MARQTTRKTVTKARKLRRNMTLPEGLLWRELRRRSGGVKIRRQHPLGPFVVDFYCAAAKLAIEIDGIAHDMGDRPERDQSRDKAIAERGVAVLRVSAKEVLDDPLTVAEAIVAAAQERCT